MKFTTEDEPDLTIPEDSILRARLQQIVLKPIKWRDKDSGEWKENQILEWWWEVTRSNIGPQFVGRKVRGECKPVITNREGNRFREWAEAVLRRPIPIGMTIETDDLVGLEAEIIVGHRLDKKDPGKVWEVVTDVAPVDEVLGGSVEPPF